MSKKRNKRARRGRPRVPPGRIEKGFDFGEQQRVLGVGDIEFHAALHEARVFACAYGLHDVVGFPRAIPSIGLVAENRSGLERAFERFAKWGCEQDGDVVDIQLMLKRGGGYQLHVSPEMERSLIRMVPQIDLQWSAMFNVAYVKQFDTTNPFFSTLRQYLKSAIAPVVIGAAVGDPKRPDIDSLTIIEVPQLIKFELRISQEGEPGYSFLEPTKPKRSAKRSADGRKLLRATDYRIIRKRTLDVAFPVSRERVRRAGLLGRVRAVPDFGEVSETQVVQAAINLMLSAELVSGDRNYLQLQQNLSTRMS